MTRELDFSRIHRFVFEDLHLMLDINSGSIHVTDETVDTFLDALEEGKTWEDAIAQTAAVYGQEDAKDVAEGIAELIDEGLLFSDIDFSDFTPHTEPIVKALCLHMAHDCNLRCGYCFADSGAYGGGRSLMSLEVGKQALDYLMDHSGTRRNLEVDFFGGEPLMNFDMVKKLVAYCREQEKIHNKNFRFTMTTNGVLIDDDVIDFCNKECHNVVLSLDGRKEVHDNMRRFVGGQPSYDVCVDHFQKFVATRGQQWYYVRGTYTHYNPDFAADVIHLADDLGFKEISMEPVVAPAEMPYALTEEDKPIILENYNILARHYLQRWREGKGYNFFHFNVDFTGGPCLPKRLSGCGSGHDYLAVSPEGDLYPCHQFVGEEDYKMGTVFTGIQKPEIAERFQKANVLTKPTCMDCWARFYCSGGCHANNIRYGGSINEPYAYGCDLQRKRIEAAIYVQTVKLLEGEGSED